MYPEASDTNLAPSIVVSKSDILKFNQTKLNDSVRNLNLPKQAAEILA